MHTLTISIQGAVNDSTSIELPDDQALPVYVKLKDVIVGTKSPKRATRKDGGITPTDAPNGDAPKPGSADAADHDR
jgi:hypothetical protein